MALDNQTDSFTSKEKIECAFDEMVPIHKLVPNPKNPNKHPERQIELLAKIIDYQGQRSPIVVSSRSGFIVKGHGRLAAIQRLGWEKCAVDIQHYEDEAQEFADMVADNKISELAEHDDEMFKLEALNLQLDVNGFDLDLLGIPDLDLSMPTAEQNEMEDSVPEVTESISKLGDLYEFGGHRLLCGDSTDKATVEKLMAGEKADMVFTDPPYGMNAVSKSGVLSKNYKNDIMGDDDTNAAVKSFKLIQNVFPKSMQFWWGANYYCSALPDSECWVVWDKNNGGSDQTDCELAWSNCRSVVRQFTQSSEKSNRVHPTQKPVSLIEWTFTKFKFDGKSVLDLFGGSGSTLIACEKTKRKCFMMELDPHYVDVIVTRWCKYTNQTKIKRNGETVDWVIK